MTPSVYRCRLRSEEGVERRANHCADEKNVDFVMEPQVMSNSFRNRQDVGQAGNGPVSEATLCPQPAAILANAGEMAARPPSHNFERWPEFCNPGETMVKRMRGLLVGACVAAARRWADGMRPQSAWLEPVVGGGAVYEVSKRRAGNRDYIAIVGKRRECKTGTG